MTDPYFYIAFMSIVNAISLPLYLIFVNKSAVDKLIRTVISVIFMVWQAYIYLNKP